MIQISQKSITATKKNLTQFIQNPITFWGEQIKNTINYKINDILTIHRANVVNYQGLSLQINAGTQIQVKNNKRPIKQQRLEYFRFNEHTKLQIFRLEV